MKCASAETGRLHVVNMTDWTTSTGSGRAQAGIGILLRPSHPLCRITFRPEAAYAFLGREGVPDGALILAQAR